MSLLDWHGLLRGDRRIAMLGEEKRHGEPWVFADCESAEAYESLFETLWNAGYRGMARRDEGSVWLGRAE